MTSDAAASDLRYLAEAVEIRSNTQYVILGEVRDCSVIAPTGGAGATLPGFLLLLSGEIYGRLYTRPDGYPLAPADLAAQRDFVAALSAANTGQGTWEPGWKIVSLAPDGLIGVQKDEVTFWVPVSGLRTQSGRWQPGQSCRVRVGKELRSLVPGFYLAVGNGTEHDRRDATGPVVRLYWNLTAGVAVRYMGLITSALNQANIPFRTKVLLDPAGYIRADAGVLYLERKAFRLACASILEVYDRIHERMRRQIPMFCKELLPGLGLAEDPGNGQSFGQSRCSLAARALWTSFLRGETSPEGRTAVLTSAFREQGIDPARPFLCPGSTDVYALDPRSAAPDRAPRPRRRQRPAAKPARKIS